MGNNISTLFAANTIILSVTILAFSAAWRGQRQEIYWGSWIAANATLALALIFFLIAPAEQDGLTIALANCLLVAGFGLRWRAAREFGGRSNSLVPILAPTLLVAALFALPAVFHYGLVYTAVNLVLTAQAIVTAYEFWRDRQDGLPSRYGLVLTYGLIAASFAARAGQGVLLNKGFASYLPLDLMLQIHMLVAVFHTSASGAFALSLAYERSAIDLREAAMRDPLTGLHNRRAFERRLQDHLANRNHGEFAIAIFDIDHFKDVNDRYGHAAGDAALRACAETLGQTLRPSDFVARIGGEEFAVILPDVSGPRALEMTDRFRLAIEARDISSHGNSFRITLSGGIAHSSAGTGDMEELMKAADASLYHAKAGGRNRIEQLTRLVPSLRAPIPVG